MPAIVEIIRLKIRSGISAAEVSRASARADSMFATIKGLTRRVLLGPDADGMYSDLCEYDSQRSLDAAHELVKREQGEAAEYFALVDMKNVKAEQLAVVSCSDGANADRDEAAQGSKPSAKRGGTANSAGSRSSGKTRKALSKSGVNAASRRARSRG